ncbi:MAG: hypothetical protein NTZ45_07455 [Methylococcales bacterium]|jgi:hypothetical protein|nr:hypothetical protein [Methylococcales bacterium]
MKTIPQNDEMLPEYNFDYTQAKPNRFAKQVVSVAVCMAVARSIIKNRSMASKFSMWC